MFFSEAKFCSAAWNKGFATGHTLRVALWAALRVTLRTALRVTPSENRTGAVSDLEPGETTALGLRDVADCMQVFHGPHKLAISLGCYRIQKPLKPGNTKKIPKNYKITHFRFGPGNMEKIPKNYKIGQKMAIFVIFRYFFRIFGAKPEMGDFVFFHIFFVFPGLKGFCIL